MTERITLEDFKNRFAIDRTAKRGLRAIELKKQKSEPKKKRVQKVMSDSFEETKDGFSLVLGMVTISELNIREHWTVTHARRAKQRSDFAFLWMSLVGTKKSRIKMPCTVTFTRYASKTLDVGDNLESSMKSCRDELCKQIGVDDNSPLYTFKYKQQLNKEYGVRVDISYEQ